MAGGRSRRSRCSRSRSGCSWCSTRRGSNRIGVPQEKLTVERTVLKPGEIQLHVRNDGPDAVRVRQVIVNDAFAPFTQSNDEHRPAGRRPRSTSSTRGSRARTTRSGCSPTPGVTIDHTITAATETPGADLGFYGLMALIGLYVGIIPVAIGMLWLPWLRGVDARWVKFLLAFTIGLLAFLGIEALLEGTDIANTERAGVRRGGARVAGRRGGVPRARRRRRLAQGPRDRRTDGIRSGLSGRHSWLLWGSASTTSGRGSRSAPRTRSARSRSAPRSSWASRSTTRPRGWPSSRRSRGSAARALGRLAAARPDRRGAGGAGRVDRRVGVPAGPGRASCSASGPARSLR